MYRNVLDRSFSRRSGLGLTLGILALAASGCVAQSIVLVGEGPVSPLGEIPTVSVVVLDDEGLPVAGASVRSKELNEQLSTSDTQGLAVLEWRGEPVSVSVSAEGFFPSGVAVEAFSENAFEVPLRPVVLRGTVTDSSGFGLGGSTVTLGDREVVTDENGRFALSRAVAGLMTAARPGWHAAQLEWSGEELVTDIALAPRIIKGLHIGANILSSETEFTALLDIAEETVVNALVIDVKVENGVILFNSQVPLARQIGAVSPLFELEWVVAEMDARGLYKIARIVSFQDPIAARAVPEISVFDPETGLAYQKRGQYFLDPSDPQARAYALDLAEEVCAAGFNEIQFDYVRYPDGYPDQVVFDVTPTEESRVATIAMFLNEASDRLHPLGCAVAADIFGFITSVPDDGGIGQHFATLSAAADVLSPMIYPSHYSTGWFGYDNPNDHPAGVVGGALDGSVTRLDGPAVVRPWLQDFYYDASQVRAEIEEAESRAMGWMLWNALSNFEWDAISPAEQADDQSDSG